MGLKIEVVNKPKQGVVTGTIPQDLVDFLAPAVTEAMKDAGNKEIILSADTEAEAKTYALYARAWGYQQEPQLNIRKIPNRREMPDTVARLTVGLLEDAKPLGRKPGGTNAPKAEK
jgi:hypothetical protein